jgi:AraC-like DNA-binding protein
VSNYGAMRQEHRLWPTGSAAHHEILAAARPAEARQHISCALRGLAQVRFLPSLAVQVSSGESETPLLGLLYLDGHIPPSDAEEWVATVYPFRAQWPDVPVVAYAHYSVDVMRQCFEAGHAGVSDLVVRGSHDLAGVVRPIVERRSAHPMIRAIIREVLRVRGPVGVDAVGILRFALEHVRDRLSVTALAAGVGVSRRTLTNRLAKVGLDSPERFLMWVRILVLAWLLRDEAYSINRAVQILGFDSPISLRHLVVRYLGHSCEWLRCSEGVGHVAQAMAGNAAIISSTCSDTGLPAESLLTDSASGIIGRP